MARLTSSELREVGFRPCLKPPHGWQYAGEVYVRELPKGPAYVLCVDNSEEVEAFVGDWMNPLAYYYWPTADSEKLSTLISISSL